MFKNLFRSRTLAVAGAKGPVDFPSLARAAEMLSAPSALMQLSGSEARRVLRYMQPKHIPEGTVFIREGDAQGTGFMVLVLEGEVTVENIVVSRVSPITVTVLGAGSMHGDLGLIDGLPRSASCTASSDLYCVLLTRERMQKLLKDDPGLGAKLMMAIAMRIGARLRDNTEKLKKYVQLTKAMQQEIDHLMAGTSLASGSRTPRVAGTPNR
ncbi:MAG: Crp/Fnr family transcriptional regulator [Rhodoferax sp.]